MGVHQRQRNPLQLRPGATVSQRDESWLQVGIDPPLAALLPNKSSIRLLLDELIHGRQPYPRDLDAEHALGKLVDVRLVVPKLAPQGDEVALLVSDGVLRRDLIDEFMRTGRPHLTLSSGPEGWTLGPFTVPGLSACLRCVDAARMERDPRRPLILEQAEPITPIAPHAKEIALALAARDLAAWSVGQMPLTFNATVTVPLGPEGASEAATLPIEERWRPHAHCGCTWDRLRR